MKTDPIRTAGDLATLVRAVRIASGLAQSEAAALCGVSAPFLSDLEGGKATVQLGRVLAVCAGLGIRMHLLPPLAIESAQGRQRRRRAGARDRNHG